MAHTRGVARAGLPVMAAAVALVTLAGDSAAQRPAVASPTRPRPFVIRFPSPVASPTRPRPFVTRLPSPVATPWRRPPARPAHHRRRVDHPGAPRAFVPLPYPLYAPYAYPGPFPVLAPATVVEPVAVAPRARVTTFAAPAPIGCAVVEVRVGGNRWRNPVPLPALGASSPAALRAAIAARLAGGGQVTLRALSGIRFVIPGGSDPAEVAVEACET